MSSTITRETVEDLKAKLGAARTEAPRTAIPKLCDVLGVMLSTLDVSGLPDQNEDAGRDAETPTADPDPVGRDPMMVDP